MIDIHIVDGTNIEKVLTEQVIRCSVIVALCLVALTLLHLAACIGACFSIASVDLSAELVVC